MSKDITLINIGNPTFVKSLVNFEKCTVLWKVCSEILEMQKNSFDFVTLPLIRDYFLNIPVADEQTLYDLSIQREPIAE